MFDAYGNEMVRLANGRVIARELLTQAAFEAALEGSRDAERVAALVLAKED